MEEIELKAKDIPWGYARCFNDACKRKDTCMHYLANVMTDLHDRFTGLSVFPTAWQQDECPCYCEKKLVKKAWGFSHLYDNVSKYHKAKLTPKQQDDIMQILARFGSTDGIQFDHYETDWNFE